METIRPAATGIRNGLPPAGGYVYRGSGEDIMPWAITDDDSVEPIEGYRNSLPRGRRGPQDKSRCAVCGWGYRSKAHKAHRALAA